MFYGLGTACREVFGTVKGVEFGLLSKKSFDTYGPTFMLIQSRARRPIGALRIFKRDACASLTIPFQFHTRLQCA